MVTTESYGARLTEQVNRDYLIAMAACPGLDPSTLRRLLVGLGSARDVWEADQSRLQEVCRLRVETVSRIERWRITTIPHQVETLLYDRGIGCVVVGDELYPRALYDLQDPPVVLFVRGEVPCREDAFPFERSVSVVGTRRASSYALEVSRWIGDTLGKAGMHVVSGLAYGVDAAVHSAVVSAHGLTSCVLACGVDVCYPLNHKPLYDQICRNGFVVSEYAPGTMVAKYRFPERNRIIAALSPAVVVVQAGEKSGALVTVESALELGRDVYVVPGPITSTHFRGSNRLLYQGAQVFIDPFDFLVDRGFAVLGEKTVKRHPPERWTALYEALDDVKDATRLAEELTLPLSHVFTGLLELELEGWIVRKAGGFYERSEAK